MLQHSFGICLLFLTKLYVISCEDGCSLTFVIDDTASMQNDIDAVKRGASGIMDIVLKRKESQIKDIVLVTFNDPVSLTRLRKKTRDRYELQTALNYVWAHSGVNEDWAEFSMSGIELGLRESQNSSYIFVFTDADSKDHQNYLDVINLCRQSQSQVFIILTDYMRTLLNKVGTKVYYEIAKACTGQVILMYKNEVSKIIEFVKTLLDMSGSGKGNGNSILKTQTIEAKRMSSVMFFIDDKTEYAIISISGDSVQISNKKGPSSNNYETISTSANFQVYKLNNPLPGTYSISIYGQSQVSVIIFGRTDFSFDYGFSVMTPKSMQFTSKEPISGSINHLSISVTDPENEVQINSAQILNTDESVIYDLPLKLSNGYYITDKYVTPNNKFKIAVLGTVIKSHNSIKRTSKMLVVPAAPSPMTTINVHYGKEVSLNCKIKSSLPIRIRWLHTKDNIEKPITASHDYILSSDETELKIPFMDIGLQGKYTCNATLISDENEYETYSTEVRIDDLEKPEIQLPPHITGREKTNITVFCKIIKGNPKPNITWLFKIKDSDKFEPIPDSGETIYIINSKLSDAGNYMCKAENKLAKEQKNTELIIEAPSTIITNNKREVYIATVGDKVLKIPCNAVGYPKPVIIWKMQSHTITSGKKYDIEDDGTLVIKNPVEQDTNDKYICEGTNKFNTASEKFNVMIRSKPEIQPSQATITIREKANISISCIIVRGHPKPNITWLFNGKIKPYSGQLIEIVHSQLSDSGQYTCIAENDVGKAEQNTYLIVEAPPVIITDDKKEVYVAAVGDRVLRIPCKAVGYPKPVVTWLVNAHAIKTDKKYDVEEDNTLVIKNPTATDTNKTYICEAINKLNVSREKFDIIVTPDLIYDDHFGNSTQVNLLEGNSTRIKCLLPHAKTDSIKWYKGGDKINITETYLDFDNPTDKDDGNYTCRVSNNLGSQSESYEVDFGYGPRFKLHMTSFDIDWKGNRDDYISCEYTSKPASNITWTFNGKNIEYTSETHIKISNWGEYICEISNPHGVIKRNFNITSQDCLIDRSINAPSNMPLIVTNTPTWSDLEKDKEILILKSNVPLILSCNNQVSTPNSFARLSNETVVYATCDHKNSYLVDGNIYTLSELGCKSKVVPTVIRTGTKCLYENSELIKVGFNGDTFVNVYEVCFDTITNLPIYTHAKMSDINDFLQNVSVEWYDYPGIKDSKSVGRYTCHTSSESCCYSKGQLVSALDVNYGPSQTSTFIENLNAVPVWQPCDKNRTTWQSLENEVRANYESEYEFSVWSGTSNPVTINGTSIPRYLWKVIMPEQSDALVLVYVNDPAPTPSDLLCENEQCNEFNGRSLNLSDKYAYCCRYEDFLKAFNYTSNHFE